MHAILVAVVLSAIPTARYSLIQGSGIRRVHVLVDAETKEVELMRVSSVRAGYYRGYVAMAVEADRLCRGYCDLDVDVDPRLDYVLRVGDEEPRALDLTAHGDSVIVKVTPPSGGLRAGGTIMLIGGIVTASIGGLTSLLSISAGALSSGFSRGTFLGLDPTFALVLGVGAIAVGVANIIIGVIMKRRAAMEVDVVPGDVPPGTGPGAPLPDGLPPPPPPPPSGTAVM